MKGRERKGERKRGGKEWEIERQKTEKGENKVCAIDISIDRQIN